MKNHYSILLIVLFFTACSVHPESVPKSKVMHLSMLLDTLDDVHDTDESIRLSQDIFQKTNQLIDTFKLTSPPLWHNFLVNAGLRKKGLCFHWSDALYLHLKQQHYRDFSFHLVGANIGSYFTEHNALLVTSKQGNIQEGIVIDPWRNSGRLYFSKLKEDKAYKWKHRIDRGCE